MKLVDGNGGKLFCVISIESVFGRFKGEHAQKNASQSCFKGGDIAVVGEDIAFGRALTWRLVWCCLIVWSCV